METFITAFQYIKGVYKKYRQRLFPRLVVTGQGASVLN